MHVRPHLAVGAAVTLGWCMAAAIVMGSASSLTSCWAGLLAALALGSIAVEPARGRRRLAIAWLGAVPPVTAQALWETTPPPSDGIVCGTGVLEAICAWPFLAGAGAAAGGAFLLRLHRRRPVGRRGRAVLAVVVLALGLIAPARALLASRGPTRATERVVARVMTGDDDVGSHDVAGLVLFHQRTDGEPTRWDLRPMLGPEGGAPLGEVIEIVRLGAGTYLRTAGSSEPETWARVEEGELRPLAHADLWTRPRSNRRAAWLAWAAGVCVALLLALRHAWLARWRTAIGRGVEAVADATGAALLSGAWLRLPPARPGPVVVFVERTEHGTYRSAPDARAPSFVAGTKYGRRLRWLASMERSLLYAVVVGALTTIPLLLSALRG